MAERERLNVELEEVKGQVARAEKMAEEDKRTALEQ